MFLIFFVYPLHASEVFQEINTEIVVREHPKTGKTFVSIAEKGKMPLEFLGKNQKILRPAQEVRARLAIRRPDYRMLDPKAKKGDYVYDGPVSDRKKVYLLAASLAATGAASAVAGAALMPAASTATAAGGAGTYAAAGAGVAAGTVSTALIKSQPDPHRDDFTHESKTELIREESNDEQAT